METSGNDRGEAREIADDLVKLLGPAEEEMLHRRKLFIQRARHAAHEALFYLGMLYETNDSARNDSIKEYCGFALRQVESIFRRVRMPNSPLDVVVPELTAQSTSAATRAGREIEHLQSAIDTWNEIAVKFKEVTANITTAKDFRKLFEKFLDDSLPKAFLPRWIGFSLPDTLRLMRKRLTLLVATLLVGIVALKVEAVSTLLFDHGWKTVVVVLYLAAPTLFWLWKIYSRRKREEIAFWDVAGRPFRSLKHAALEPDQLMRRWPEIASAARIDVPAKTATEMVEKESEFFKSLVKDLRPPASDGMVKLTHGGLNYRLAWTLALWALGLVFCLFGLPLFGDPTGSTSITTVYVISAILMGILWVARVVDFWEFLEALPMRLILLTIVVTVGVGMWNDWDRWFFIPLLGGAAFYGWWYKQNPLRATRKRFAFVLILVSLMNLSGLFTQNRAGWDPAKTDVKSEALVRVSSGQWPMNGNQGNPVVVLAASGGGSRAAVYAGLTLAKLHGISEIPWVENDDPENVEVFGQIARNLQAISSVSGGSLANAAYLSRRWREQELTDLPAALSQDFIGPTLWGLLAPGLNRGDGIEQNWQGFEKRKRDWLNFERYPCGTRPAEEGKDGNSPRRKRRAYGVGLGNLCLSDLATKWTAAGGTDQPPPFPMPLFNSSSLDGHDIVISPLDKSLYTNEKLHQRAEDRKIKGKPTWVYDRDGIYGLEDLLPDEYDLHLSAAVRASANFPFGFPLVDVKSTKKLVFSPRQKHRLEREHKEVRVTDGGALSNSGMFPLYNLLVNEQEDLRERGVLLIIVDASKMPTYPDLSEKATNLKGTISDQGPIGQQLHRRMFDHLEAIYGDMFAVFQIDLTPDEKKNILTTWALSKKSVKTLSQIFNERWNEEKDSLRPKWEHLQKANLDRKIAREILEGLPDPAARSERYQELLAKLMTPGALELSGPERRLLQILRDDYLAPTKKGIYTLDIGTEKNPLPLVSHDRPPLD